MKHITKIERMLSYAQRKDMLQMFLDPSRAGSTGAKFIWPNSHSKPACPVYQRGTVDGSTLDVGDHQTRGIMLTPHVSAPMMLSHSRLASQRFVWADLNRAEGGRLYDDTMPGYVAGNGASITPFNSFCIPQFQAMGVGTVLTLPIHGSYGTPFNSSSNSRLSVAQMCLEDFTAVLNAGSDTGVRAIPVEVGDTISVLVVGDTTSAAFAVGDLVLDVVSTASTGAPTTTSSNMIILGAPLAGVLPFLAAGQITIPAGGVGVVSVALRCTVASRFVSFARVVVKHDGLLSTANVATGLGVYSGNSMSGVQSLRSVAQEARVTACSVLITNTASSLNANGFITGAGIPAGLPASFGIYGEDSIASVGTAKTFQFLEGSYAAIRPADDLNFSALDASPDIKLNRVIWYVRGQDATPVTFKIEYQSVVEIVSADPLFPPMLPHKDPVFVEDVERLSEAAAYMILSENNKHIAKILGVVGKAARYLAPGIAHVNPELGALIGGVGEVASAGNKLLSPKKKPNPAKKGQTRSAANS